MASWPGVMRVTLRFTRTIGDDMVNVIHTRNALSAVPDIGDLAAACVAVRDSLWEWSGGASDLRFYTADEVTLADITAVSVDPTNIGLFSVTSVNQAGLNTSAPLSPQIAVVASHRSSIASRAARGRTYHGGLTTSAQNSPTGAYPNPTSAFLADLATMWTRLDTALLAVTQEHVIASEAAETAYPVISRKFPAKFYTQRRRN